MNSRRRLGLRPHATRASRLAALLATLTLSSQAQEVRESAGGSTASLPAPEQILADLRRANRYFMDQWPDPGEVIVTNRARPSNIWPRAVYYEGLLALYTIDPDPVYYDYAVAWGEAHNWGLRDGNILTRDADNQAAGQTYIDLYRLDSRPERILTITASINAMLATDKIDDWDWIDALQMAMPVFAKLGVLYNDDAYFERMYRMYRFTRDEHGENGLFNPSDGLWWRDASYDPPFASPNGKHVYWSRGNGWVLMALARVLAILPANQLHRDVYREDFRTMAQALAPLQRDDGFWNASLVDPEHFGGPETSGTAMFVYGLAYGLNAGLLDEASFLPAVSRGWGALSVGALRPDGSLGYVQSTGADPEAGQPVTYESRPDFEDFALGAFLLAGTEVMKLVR
jgi:unsaturated rhamnogalacturonyl hydrolase